MSEVREKLTVWEKLSRKWEHLPFHLHYVEDAQGSGGACCAMEIELRAMSAKADVAFDQAVAALRKKPAHPN